MVFEGDAIIVRAAVAYLTQLEGKIFGAETIQEVQQIVKGGIGDVEEEEWLRCIREAGKS
jgi:hypothetical protein